MKHRLELFECEVLSCKMTKEACAGRYRKAEACRKTEPHVGQYIYVPSAWALYVPACRGCEVGLEHAVETRTPKAKLVFGKKPVPFKIKRAPAQ